MVKLIVIAVIVFAVWYAWKSWRKNKALEYEKEMFETEQIRTRAEKLKNEREYMRTENLKMNAQSSVRRNKNTKMAGILGDYDELDDVVEDLFDDDDDDNENIMAGVIDDFNERTFKEDDYKPVNYGSKRESYGSDDSSYDSSPSYDIGDSGGYDSDSYDD